jgi:hypothetical protein
LFLSKGAAVDLHFVVNDLRARNLRIPACQNPDSSNAIKVVTRGIFTRGAVAPLVAKTMSEEVAKLYDGLRDYDELQTLPAMSQAFSTDAKKRLREALAKLTPPLKLESFPELEVLYDAFLAAQQLRRERVVELRNLELSAKIAEASLLRISEELALSGEVGRLLQMSPAWRVRTLDSYHLSTEVELALYRARAFLYPMMSLWYPESLQKLANGRTDGVPVSAVFQQLLDASPSSGTPELAMKVSAVLHFIDEEIPWADLSSNNGAREIVVSIPRPGSSSSLGYRSIAGNQEFWKGVVEGRPTTLKLTPEDLYSATSGASVLFCNEALPVIRYLGLYVARSSSSDVLNRANIFLQGTSDRRQDFLDDGGFKHYVVNDPKLLPVKPRLYFGPDTTGLEMFEKDNKRQLLGLSPFAPITFDFTGTTPAALGLSGDIELLLVMEMEFRGHGQRLRGFKPCDPNAP